MKLTPSNATALVVDLQEKLVPAMNDSERLLERSKFFLAGLAVYKIPVVQTRQYPKGLGDTLQEIRDVVENEVVFDKTTFSCLGAKQVRDYFVSDARPNVLLAGIEAHICLQQTALDLLELGKKVYLICDCVTSRRAYDYEFALKRMIQAGVVPTTSESVLFEIANEAGSPEFKALSKLATGRK